MLQVPYEKGYDMSGFKLFFFLSKSHAHDHDQIKITLFSEQEKSAILKGWHVINNFKRGFFVLLS